MAQSDLSPSEPTAELAYEHLLGAVERRGLSVYVVPDHFIVGYLAQINMQNHAVEVAHSVTEDLEQLVMVLAHELAHAYDPDYRMTWMHEFSATRHAESERELVAQTAANEFCSLYLIDVRRASELYIRHHGTRMSRLLRLRTDVALCSLLPRTARAKRLLMDADRRWRYRWVPFVARRPLHKHTPLLRYKKAGA